MSDIKMCDNCGKIFSCNESGWDSYTRNRTQRVPGSSHEVVVAQAVMHMCGACNGGTAIVRPRLEIETKADDDDK